MFGRKARELREIEADIREINKRIAAKKDATAAAATRVIDDENKTPDH